MTLPKLPLSKVSSGPKPCVTFATNSSVLTSKGDSPRLQPGRTGAQVLCSFVRRFLFLCFSPPPLPERSEVTRPSTNQEAPQLPVPLPHGRPREEATEVTFKPKINPKAPVGRDSCMQLLWRTHIYIYILYIYIDILIWT